MILLRLLLDSDSIVTGHCYVIRSISYMMLSILTIGLDCWLGETIYVHVVWPRHEQKGINIVTMTTSWSFYGPTVRCLFATEYQCLSSITSTE